MREFTIVHLSDLHFRRDEPSTWGVLCEAVKNVLDGIVGRPLRILVVTGDIVHSRTRSAFLCASVAIRDLGSYFDEVVISPGNHDVKLLGNFIRRPGLFRATFGEYACLERLDWGIHIVGLDSTANRWARGRVLKPVHNQLTQEAQRVDRKVADEVGDGSLLRIAALHHHPLPLVAGEGARALRVVKEDRFMYLDEPASVLRAMGSHNTSILFHGHKHVQGVIRYSVEARTHVQQGGVDPWDSLYVVSCPSSTGETGDAGFNVLRFHLGNNRTCAELSRYQRTRNIGAFELVDTNRPGATIPLELDRRLARPFLIDLKARLTALKQMPWSRNELRGVCEELLAQREFRLPKSPKQISWGDCLYVLQATRDMWESYLDRYRAHVNDGFGDNVSQALGNAAEELWVTVFTDGDKPSSLDDVWQEHGVSRDEFKETVSSLIISTADG